MFSGYFYWLTRNGTSYFASASDDDIDSDDQFMALKLMFELIHCELQCVYRPLMLTEVAEVNMLACQCIFLVIFQEALSLTPISHLTITSLSSKTPQQTTNCLLYLFINQKPDSSSKSCSTFIYCKSTWSHKGWTKTVIMTLSRGSLH